jgi:filamentous hemagglutinin
MIQIPDNLFAANDDASDGSAAPDFGTELEQARRAAAQMQASAAASRALHDLDRSFDDAQSDPAAWAGAFEAEAQRIRRDDLGEPMDDGGLARDFDDLAAAKLATIRRLGAARELDQGRQGLTKALDAYASMAADAASDVETSILRDQARATIARMDQAGFLRTGEAEELESGFFAREDSARATRLIDDDPDAAITALSDPSRFTALAPDARLRLRDRAEIRAEDAVREAAQAAESMRQGQIAGLMLRLDGGEADRADIMEAAGGGWLNDAERERALALWERQRHDITRRETDLSRVRAVFDGSGAPLNINSEDDRRALNVHFEDMKASWLAAGLSQDQLNPLIVDYLGVTRSVPTFLSRDISGVFRGGTPEQRLGIADLFGLLLRRIFEWILPWSGPSWPVDNDMVEPRPPRLRPDPRPEEPHDPPWSWRPPGRDDEVWDLLPLAPIRPPGTETPGRNPPLDMVDAFAARDLAEGMLINALIDSGWPRDKAPDRAAALMSGTLESNDRFASADRQAFQDHLSTLADTGRIAAGTLDRIASAAPFARNAGAPDPPAAAPDAGEAMEPPPADPLDPGQRAQFNNARAAVGEAADVVGSAVAPAPSDKTDQSPNQPPAADGQAQEPARGDTDNDVSAPGPKARPDLSGSTSTLVDVANGATNVRDLPRDENGLVRIGRYLLTEEAASLLERALRPNTLTERELQGEIQANRSLNDAQKGVLLEVLRERLDRNFLRSGTASRNLESDATYALRMLDHPRNQTILDWKQAFASLAPGVAAVRGLMSRAGSTPVNSSRQPSAPAGALETAERRSVSSQIATGHAFDKHVVTRGEFPGIKTKEDFARHIDHVIQNRTDYRDLVRGRSVYWHKPSGTVVIRDPGSSDGGTAFKPKRGERYFYEDLD